MRPVKRILSVMLGVVVALGLAVPVVAALSAPAMATATCPDGSPAPDGNAAHCPGGSGNEGTTDGCNPTTDTNCPKGPTARVDACVKVALPILSGGDKCVSNAASEGGAIVVYLRSILRLLSGAVGLVVFLMIIIAGVQYMTSLGDPGRVKSAKSRLQNAIIALVLYLSMFAILTFIVPGGIL